MNNITKSTDTSSIKYHGDITVKVMNKDKCLKSLVLHNNGYEALFEFLVYCLTHKYEASLAPNSIRTFAFTNSQSTESISWEDAPNKALSETSTINFTQVDTKVKEEDGDYKAVFTFLVPVSLLSAKDGILIDTIAIYSDKYYREINNPCAVFTFPLDTSNSIDSRLKEEDLIGTNLVILWEMSFSN